MTLKVSVLGSSSKGNSTLVYSKEQALLFDIGLSVKYICDNLRELGVDPSGIDGILVSHEHRDHIRSVAKFSEKFGIPVYVSKTTHALALDAERGGPGQAIRGPSGHVRGLDGGPGYR